MNIYFWNHTKQTVYINNKCNNQLYHVRFRADRPLFIIKLAPDQQ